MPVLLTEQWLLTKTPTVCVRRVILLLVCHQPSAASPRPAQT